jgi:MoxR-like ATPase
MQSATADAIRDSVLQVRGWLQSRIVGQQHLIDRLLIALLTGGHLLVEGAPGLAKTRAIKELARAIEGRFHRIQFTPDLLPSDITGTDVFRPQDGSFTFEPGPIFNNLILADEINRAPAKVQSALLEAMAERQVSHGRRTLPLPELFLVMATQNPIEQEGTYPLPEAQLDRFLLHVEVGYPDAAAEREILRLVRGEAVAEGPAQPGVVLTQHDVFAVRRQLTRLHMSESIERYLIALVQATRDPAAWGSDLAGQLAYGGSPRATLALDQGARAHAWLSGRDFVVPEDVLAVAHDALRHRIIPGFEAQAAGVQRNAILDTLLARVPGP